MGKIQIRTVGGGSNHHSQHIRKVSSKSDYMTPSPAGYHMTEGPHKPVDMPDASSEASRSDKTWQHIEDMRDRDSVDTSYNIMGYNKKPKKPRLI